MNKNPRWQKRRKWGAEKLYYISHRLYLLGHRKTAYLVKYINLMIFRVFLPPEVEIGKRLDLPHGGFGVVIHKDTKIGNDAIIFHGVTIANGGAVIGDRVYIGTGAVIIGAVTIGDDSIIGANAVVNFNVPRNSTVVGQIGKILYQNEE